MSNIDSEFIVHPPPESFDPAEPLLDQSDGQHNICQNIQCGTVTIDIFAKLKFEESVRQKTRLRITCSSVQSLLTTANSLIGRDL